MVYVLVFLVSEVEIKATLQEMIKIFLLEGSDVVRIEILHG